MASIRQYRNGTVQVLWREAGKQTSASFDGWPVAEAFKGILESDGSEAAYMWLRRRELGGDVDGPAPAGPTLDEWMDQYIAGLTGVTAGTRWGYERVYALRWQPMFGSVPVATLTHAPIARRVNEMAEKWAVKTVANAHGLLSAALSAAVDDPSVPLASNPCRNIRLPSGEDDEEQAEEMTCLSPAQFGALYGVVAEYWQALVATLYMTGLRWGEATALQVRDLELDGTPARVRVRRAWKQGVSAGRVLGAPKHNSRRVIAIPPELVALLLPLVAGLTPDRFVFLTRQDNPVRSSTFRNNVWLPARAKAELGVDPRVHDLRHSHASWLIAQRVPLPAISRRLGHKSITVTVDVYGHLMQESEDEIVAAISHGVTGLGLTA